MASVNLQVTALCKPDDQFQSMKKVWEACTEALLDVPDEVYEYFGEEGPGDDDMMAEDVELTEFSENMVDGWQINLSELPENAEILQIRVHY